MTTGDMPNAYNLSSDVTFNLQGMLTCDSVPLNWGTYDHFVYPYCYPTVSPGMVYVYSRKKDNFEISFKIVKRLMENKLVERMSLKKFILLVNEIAAIL